MTRPVPMGRGARPRNYIGRKRFQLARRLWQDKVAIVSGIIIVGVFTASWLAPYQRLPDPNRIDLAARLSPPGTAGHPLGTDELGRDLLSRIIWGGRISITVGVVAVVIALSGGGAIGIISGFYGGWLDLSLMRFIDILMAFPYILLALLTISILGPGLINAMIAISIAGMPYYARIIRGSVLEIKESDFVKAAEASGASNFRIMLKHIVPNIAAPVIVAATLDVGWMIMAGAGMSFLGLGAQPPTAEWGLMLSNGSDYIRSAPHLAIFAGLAISLIVLALNFLGDGIRDALDPKVSRYRF
jgi:peptide/nickel transport system permease protein